MYVADLARSWGGAHLESKPWIIGIIKPCNMHNDYNTLQELIDLLNYMNLLTEIKHNDEIDIIGKQTVC